MSRRSKVRTRLKASLFSRQKQLLSFKVLKGISLVGTYAHPRDILGDIPGICHGYSCAAWEPGLMAGVDLAWWIHHQH